MSVRGTPAKDTPFDITKPARSPTQRLIPWREDT